MRAGRLAAGVALVLALAGASGCGGDSGKADLRKRLEAYSQQENRVVGRLRPDVEAINRSYVAFSRGKLEGDAAITRLTRAESVVRDVRADVYRLQPPKEAQELQRRLERYLDVTVDLAVQTRRLAGYKPAAAAALKPLRGINRRLQRDLGDTKDPDGQARVLARFAAGLDDVLTAMRAVEVPAVQAPAHRDQVGRLERTRKLAGQLRSALTEQDAERVAVLLGRFRDQAADSADTTRLTRAGLAAYARRVDRLKAASADLQREQLRLFKTVEPKA